jgi:hypothetical protein
MIVERKAIEIGINADAKYLGLPITAQYTRREAMTVVGWQHEPAR